MRLPPRWKRWLLPVWNKAHELRWLVGEYAGALATGRVERCSCCGRLGLMLYRRRAIPPRLIALWGLSPRVARALVRKETLICSRCGAKLRARRMAVVLMDRACILDPPAMSLRAWANRPEIQQLHIAEINRIDGVHEAIAGLPNLRYSEYLANAEPGTTHDGVRCESLSRLSYDDASFDLVITSETLEHVPDLQVALAEIRRVLKPGGLHVFTVPLMPGVPRTYARRRIGEAGDVEDLAPPICHPGGDTGYPVFTEFGADLIAILDRAGFSTEIHFGPLSEDDLAQVFVSRKV